MKKITYINFILDGKLKWNVETLAAKRKRKKKHTNITSNTTITTTTKYINKINIKQNYKTSQ